MSKFIRNNTLAILCTFALVFAAAAGVEAQTEEPIFDDDILCSIRIDDTFWVAPVALQSELEAHLNALATVESAASLMLRIPPATPLSSVRLEGGSFGPGLTQDLENLGYATLAPAQTVLPSANEGFVHTL